MRSLILLLCPLILTGLFFGCQKTKDTAEEPVKPNYNWLEEFDTIETAISKGWVIINNSRPLGTGSWGQGSFIYSNGKLSGFPASSYKYSGNDYATCGFNSGSGISTLSAWMITPPTMMKDGDSLIFHARTTVDPADYPDRLQVRLNDENADIDVGSGILDDLTVASATGKFKKILLDINPDLKTTGQGAFPAEWTRYVLTVSNMPTPALHRFAFRYFVIDGGTAGDNSDAVGVDSVAFISK